MLTNNDKAKLEFVLQMLDEVQLLIQRYESTYKALIDFAGKNSILFNMLQIGEKLNKIQSLEIRDLLPIKEAYSIRNRITHDYDGIDLQIVEEIITFEFPKLKSELMAILNNSAGFKNHT